MTDWNQQFNMSHLKDNIDKEMEDVTDEQNAKTPKSDRLKLIGSMRQEFGGSMRLMQDFLMNSGYNLKNLRLP